MAERDTRKDWPPGVTPISFETIGRLGVGEDWYLYWDGRPVVTRRRLELSRRQKAVGIVTVIAVIVASLGSLASGLDAGLAFGCKVHLWTAGCKG
jgi:hypothetical protein